MELKHLVIVLSVAGTGFLYVLSLFSQPTVVSLDDVEDFEGKQVVVEGVVVSYRVTTFGGQQIVIQDRNESELEVIVYVEEETDVEYGDVIQATGVVQQYGGEWEVVVNTARGVVVVEKWQDTTYPLWQLAVKPQGFVGRNVKVSGFVDRVYDSFFYLMDSTSQYSVVVYFDMAQRQNFSGGEWVQVGGRFEYDDLSFRYVISATEFFKTS